MNIIVHATNIDWNVDDAADAKKLPKKTDVKMRVDDWTDVDMFVDDNLADELSDKYGFCVNGCNYTWEEDLSAAIKTVKRILSKKLKNLKKLEKSYDLSLRGKIDFESEQKKYRKVFAELAKLGVNVLRDMETNKITALDLEIRR